MDALAQGVPLPGAKCGKSAVVTLPAPKFEGVPGMLEAPFCEVSTPVADLASEARSALRLSGNVCPLVFGWLCAKFQLSIMWPTDERALRVWPKYKLLMRAVRHAIFIQPLTAQIEDASQEQIDEETGLKFIDALRRNVDEINAEEAQPT